MVITEYGAVFGWRGMPLLIATIVALAGACSGERARGSAGSESAWGPQEGWRVASAPAVDIGGIDADADHQLYQVRFARRLSDGTIVVVNAGSHELRFFGSDGAYLRSAGRRGEGPGEFRGPYWLFVLPGDTLLAYDSRLRRVSVLDGRGEFVRTYRLEVPTVSWLLGAFDDGRLVGAVNWLYDVGPESLSPRRPAFYLVYDRDGATVDTIGSFTPEANFVYKYKSVSWGMDLPFAPSAHAAVGRELFFEGHSDAYEIRVRTADGELKQLIRKEHEPLEVRAEDVEAYRAEHEADESMPPHIREAAHRGLEAMLDQVEIPDVMPAFADLRVDDMDHLWVRRYRRPGDPQPVWDVFDAAGRLLGAVETPPDVSVQQIGRDVILATCHDEIGLEHVLLYRLEREVKTSEAGAPEWAPICAVPAG